MHNTPVSNKRRTYLCLIRLLMLVSVGITCGLMLFLVGYVLLKGLPNITWQLLTTEPSYLSGTIAVLPDILTRSI